MLHVYAALAEKERALISLRTQERARPDGVQLGGPNAQSLLNRDGRLSFGTKSSA
jgi:hypothetical protein